MVGTYSVVLDLGERRRQFLAEIAEALAPWDTVDERLVGAARDRPPAVT